MHWLSWIVIAIGLLLGGWLAFDGSRALIKGDYVTPASGAYAGQLGPWSKLVSAIGIPPRSNLMKTIHVALGVAWLVVIGCFAANASWAWWGVFVCAVLTLWYLPFGTLLSIIQIALLLTPPIRNAATS